MEPFDSDTQRLLIEVCLRQGRRSEAHRLFTLFGKALQQQFGREPDFGLADVDRDLGAEDSPAVPDRG